MPGGAGGATRADPISSPKAPACFGPLVRPGHLYKERIGWQRGFDRELSLAEIGGSGHDFDQVWPHGLDRQGAISRPAQFQQNRIPSVTPSYRLDTHLLAYCFDDRESEKQKRALKLLDRGDRGKRHDQKRNQVGGKGSPSVDQSCDRLGA